MRRFLNPSVAIASLLLVASCKDDLKPVTETWNASAAEWQAKIDALKKEDADQRQQISGVCATEGLDPTNVAAKTCGELKMSADSDKGQTDALTEGMGRHKALVDAAIKRGKLLEVSVAMDAAKAELNTLLARATQTIELRRETTKKLNEAVAVEFEAAKAAAQASEAKAALWKQAAMEKKPLELTDIRFTKGTAQLEGEEAGEQKQLKEVVAWANGCPAMTFSITAHESKELPAADAMKLTNARALAVKKYLIDNGVAANKIVSAKGEGFKNPVADEPEPTAPAAKDMNPEDLETLRAKNRRTTIQAVEACPAERAEVVNP